MRADVNYQKDLELVKAHGRIVVSVIYLSLNSQWLPQYQ